MKRRKLIVGSATVATAALAGCLGSAQENNGGNPNSSSERDSARTITVSESGETEADPNLAVFQAGVEVTGDDADEVRDELATRSDELYDELLAYGIDDDNVTTGEFNIRDRIDERRMEEEGADLRSEEEIEEYRYYEGTHAFTVEVEDVENAGEVVDTAVDAGADDIGRIEFTLSDEKREELREEALKEAIDRARSEADFVANEVDATVVEAKRIDTSGGRVTPVREDLEMDDTADADAAEPATDLHPDDVTVSATADIKYTIE